MDGHVEHGLPRTVLNNSSYYITTNHRFTTPDNETKARLVLRFASNLTTFPTKTERFKKSFFPATTVLWNSIDHVECNTLSLNAFKPYLKNFFDISSYTRHFDYSIDRYSSILHTSLRLNCCTLNYYPFNIDCIVSPACSYVWREL